MNHTDKQIAKTSRGEGSKNTEKEKINNSVKNTVNEQ